MILGQKDLLRETRGLMSFEATRRIKLQYLSDDKNDLISILGCQAAIIILV